MKRDKIVSFVKEDNSDTYNVSEATKVLGSLLIVLSGVILYLEKVLVNVDIGYFLPQNFNLENRHELNFVWYMAECISALLIIIGHHLKAYFYSYVVPVYCYVLLGYYLLFDTKPNDYGYEYAYAIGITLIVFLIMHWARNAAKSSMEMEIEDAKTKIKELMDEDS